MRANAADRESTVDGTVDGTHPIEDNRLSLPDPKSVTYIDYDNPFALVNQSVGMSPHIAQLSQNAWVNCGEDIHVLECFDKGHIRIEPVPGGEPICTDLRPSSFDCPFEDTGNHFHAHYTPTIHHETASSLKISRFHRNRKVLDASNLADAVRGCDTYVAEKVLRGRLSLA
jgi:ATP-dependent helicase IRC3